MYVLQSLPVVTARWVEASLSLVASPWSAVCPTVPVRVPHWPAGPGASASLVPGATPTIVMSNGDSAVVVPGTRKATASMGSLLYLVPVVFQQVVLKSVNGMNFWPSLMVAHHRLLGSVAPLTPWI